MATAPDTLEYARQLRECGFTDEQAEGQARALAAVMTDSLATAEDIRRLEARFDAADRQLEIRIDELDKRMELRFTAVEGRISGVEERISRVEERVAAIEGRLTSIEERVSAIDGRLDSLVTREELHEALRAFPTRQELDSRFAESEANTRGLIVDLERKLTLRLGGIMVAGIGAMSAVLRLL